MNCNYAAFLFTAAKLYHFLENPPETHSGKTGSGKSSHDRQSL
jgi:hypothetical protein